MGLPSSHGLYKVSDGTTVKVTLLDTEGQEKYRSINEGYYKNADCCLLVYDISNRNSFEECKKYYNPNIKEKCKEGIKVILLGNKTDLEDQRQVPSEEGASFALENNYHFMEISCLQNKNVAGAFESLIEMTNIELKKSNSSNLRLSISKHEEKKDKNNKENNKNNCNC